MISILIPTKNAAHYLTECLDSIIHQTFQDWECIVVNDHSSDHTLNILYSFSLKDPRIKFHQNKGKGIISALQLAYAHSSGNYITRMDSDDVMLSNKLEVLWNNLQQHGNGYLSVGKVRYFSEEALGNGYKKYESWLNGLTEEQNNFKQIYKECVVPSPCWMIHRSDFELCGGFSSDVYPEDYDLCFRFYQEKLQIVSDSPILHKWRDYPSRSSRTDEHYSDNRFLDLKTHYFLKLDYQVENELFLWGAGKKGKIIAKNFLAKGFNDFHWICNNKNKIGRDIYGLTMEDLSIIDLFPKKQIVVAVAMKTEQEKIQESLVNLGLIEGIDYFFFC